MVTGLMILVGFVGSALFGIYVDKTKQFTPVCKMAYACAALMGIAMMEVSSAEYSSLEINDAIDLPYYCEYISRNKLKKYNDFLYFNQSVKWPYLKLSL